ncbi:hypothetical protein [Paenibacillus sp. KS-LC4]
MENIDPNAAEKLLLQLVSCLKFGESALLPAEQHHSLRYSERMMR